MYVYNERLHIFGAQQLMDTFPMDKTLLALDLSIPMRHNCHAPASINRNLDIVSLLFLPLTKTGSCNRGSLHEPRETSSTVDSIPRVDAHSGEVTLSIEWKKTLVCGLSMKQLLVILIDNYIRFGDHLTFTSQLGVGHILLKNRAIMLCSYASYHAHELKVTNYTRSQTRGLQVSC